MILFPIFSVLTLQDINRQKENSTRLLLEKGAALIRSFEAGTRTGMMATTWDGLQLQKLLTETARLPDINYLLVTDTNGTIVAHNDLGQRGRRHGEGLDFRLISRNTGIYWRRVQTSADGEVFEVFRKFTPVEGLVERLSGQMMRSFRGRAASASQIIFVGLDMDTVEQARRSDTRHTVITGVVLLLAGFSGVILLFLAQRYRETKTSLSQVKAFSDTLVEHMPMGLVAIDNTLRIASFNHTAELVLQQKADQVTGKKAEASLPVALWQEITMLEGGTGTIEKEIECLLTDGRRIALQVSATVLQELEGIFHGYILLFKDLTEVKGLRQEIARSQRLASVGSLAAGVAHEIRNPLSSIKGFATYFKERHRNVPEDQRIADIMTQEVDRLNRVVGQLLELARPVSISAAPVAIESLIERGLQLVSTQSEEKGVQVRTVFSEQIPMVYVDPDRMTQALLNLFLNAVDAMGQDGCLEISAGQDEAGNGLAIRIGDNGVGIGEDDMAHVFDPYFTTKPSGTGLGLAIVKSTIEAHNGKIEIESVPGKGTSITIFLPGMADAGRQGLTKDS